MQSERDRHFALLRKVFQSRSWRIIAPLRGAGQLFRVNSEGLRTQSRRYAHSTILRRCIRKLLLVCLGVAHRHPEIHARARAIYRRIPGLRTRLSAFARANSVSAQLSDDHKTMLLQEAFTIDNENLPEVVSEVYRRLSVLLAERHPRSR